MSGLGLFAACMCLQYAVYVSGSLVNLYVQTTYEESIEQCEARGLTMIKIETQSELEEVNQWMKDHSTIPTLWLGMKYNEERFMWLDNSSVTITNWDTVTDDEPDQLDKQKCAVIRADLYWDSRECNNAFNLVCQSLKVKSDETPEILQATVNLVTQPVYDQHISTFKQEISLVTEKYPADVDNGPTTQQQPENDPDRVPSLLINEPATQQQPATDPDRVPSLLTNELGAVVKTSNFGVYLSDQSPNQIPYMTSSELNPIQCAMACLKNDNCSLFSTGANSCKLYLLTIRPMGMISQAGSFVWKKSQAAK